MRKITLKVPTGTSHIEIDTVTMDYKFFNIYGERLFNSSTKPDAPEYVPLFDGQSLFARADVYGNNQHGVKSGLKTESKESYSTQLDVYKKLSGRVYDKETQAEIDRNWQAVWDRVEGVRSKINLIENRFNTVL